MCSVLSSLPRGTWNLFHSGFHTFWSFHRQRAGKLGEAALGMTSLFFDFCLFFDLKVSLSDSSK